MIEGHIYLSAVVPPYEQWPLVIGLVGLALGIDYLFVKAVLRYARKKGW